LCTGAYATFEADRVIERINQVADRVRKNGRTVIVIQHEAQEGPFVYGTDGWQLAPGLRTAPSDIFVRKTATDSFHMTDLDALLQSHGIDELIVCGMQSDFCVDTTIRRALALGYPVTLISDGHTTLDNSVLSATQITAHHNETLSNITSFGPRVTLMSAAALTLSL
jgi:nicotinamidase-related amidase